jgi:hypothetical protein
MELIWDSERDLGSQVTALARILESGKPPAGVSISFEDSQATI